MAEGEADINRCPPGGAQGIVRLAALTGRPVLPLDQQRGIETPRRLAVIDEDWCIGCTLCIKACPVDCIVGASKQMHTVIDELCTGCDLCLPVCPVDCISMVEVTGARTGWDAWSPQQADEARAALRLPSTAHRAREARERRAPCRQGPGQARRPAEPDAHHRPAAAGAQARGHRGRDRAGQGRARILKSPRPPAGASIPHPP